MLQLSMDMRKYQTSLKIILNCKKLLTKLSAASNVKRASQKLSTAFVDKWQKIVDKSVNNYVDNLSQSVDNFCVNFGAVDNVDNS